MSSCADVRVLIAEDGPLVLDGGLSALLEAGGAELKGDPLWTSRLLHSDPQAVRDAHRSFLLSGADVISTATYQASVWGFMEHLKLSSEEARELLRSGVVLAQDAVKDFHSVVPGNRRVVVVGSVGPYGASLHDGSEYSGAYADSMSTEQLKDWHRPQVDALLSAGLRLLAFETIPSLKEAEALMDLLREFPHAQAWLSFSCQDALRISDRSLFSDAVGGVSRCPQLVAVGVNCCPAADVESLLRSAQSQRSPPTHWVVYPNSGGWDAEEGTWRTSGGPSPWPPAVTRAWVNQGAALIGGCCQVSPNHIAALRRQMKGGDEPPVNASNYRVSAQSHTE